MRYPQTFRVPARYADLVTLEVGKAIHRIERLIAEGMPPFMHDDQSGEAVVTITIEPERPQ